MRLLHVTALAIALAVLAGCYAYPYPYPPPYAYAPQGPSKFDRAWSAAGDAMREQGVQIMREDRATGAIDGRAGNLGVTARVIVQADARVRVEFNARGAQGDDPGLVDRISRSYDARMGR